MIKEMNSEIFKQNLLMVISKLVEGEDKSNENYYFIINPVTEDGKPRNSLDEFMRLNVLNLKFIKNKIFCFEEVITTLAFYAPLVPIWINVSIVKKEPIILFQLDVSLRFRKPSLLRNQDTGHPPFKIV